MKKLILSLVFLLATGTSFMNANTNFINNLTFGDCTQAAWDWGTEAGGGDPQAEYEYTNSYFEYYCNENGTFKLGMAPE
jgi:hypothetical protein